MWEILTGEEPYATMHCGAIIGNFPSYAPNFLKPSQERSCAVLFKLVSCCSILWWAGGIVSNTLRPRIPKRCDPEWKRLMEECWSPEPAARPSFTEITNRLRSMSVAVRIRKRPNVTSR